MPLKSHENSVSAWAFLIGVILSIIIGLSTTLLPIPLLAGYSKVIFGILVILGLIVGFTTNVSTKDSQTFLIAGTILVVVSSFGKDSITGSLIGIGVGDIVASTFAALLTLFVPATIIVALKTVFSVSKI